MQIFDIFAAVRSFLQVTSDWIAGQIHHDMVNLRYIDYKWSITAGYAEPASYKHHGGLLRARTDGLQG